MSPQKRRLADLKKARKSSSQHSSRIRFLRQLVPVCAFFIFGSLFAWPYLEKALYAPTPEETKILKEPPTVKNTLINPKLNGFDGGGRPYRIVAKEAQQREENKADLKTPKSHMLLEDGTAVKVSSKKGQYDKECNSLDYNKDVQLDTSSGYHLETEAAHVDLKHKYAKGDQALTGCGPTGEVSSEKGFIVENETLHLLGPSKLFISADDTKKPFKKDQE